MKRIRFPARFSPSARALAAGVGVLLLVAGATFFAACGAGKERSGGQSGYKTLYTCGMHPEIVEEHPGNCPKCGMKLRPMDPDRARTILAARGELPAPGQGAQSAGKPAGTAPAGKERKPLYWRSSMEPGFVRKAPGKDTMGMDLVPVYEDDVSGGPTITVDPVTVQNMAVRTATVRLGPLEKVVRTVGTVAYNEAGLSAVTPKAEGWVQKVYVDKTGVAVKKGDPLFEFYSPQLYSARQEYLVALRDLKKARQSGSAEAANMARERAGAARDRLRFFDIDDGQIQEMERAGAVDRTLTLRSRIDGIVTEKKVVEGDFLQMGMPAYQIADLSTVWVMAKVYESDVPFVRRGQKAKMTLDSIPGRAYEGTITYVYPYLQAGTRETPVRLEFANPGYDLKPGMYATVEIRSELAKQAILVPDTAVIDTGERKVAYVVRAPGKFEPRELSIGARSGAGDLQVLSGVAPGEKIVVSGQFLLDSESRLREASLKMLAPGAVATQP